MRIPSGTTDQYIYFYAVDATDFTSPETGLSSFTVYRSRNGAAAAAFTTPTINETDSSNMAGVYELLLDEDMTIDAGDDEQEMVFHISHAGMAPVVRTITLFRPKITAGYTLGVESDGDLTKVNTLDGHTVQTGDSYAIVNGDHGLVSIQDDVDLILADTNELQTDDIPGLLATAQTDLDTLTGTDGATLATSQANYAPAKAGDAMTITNLTVQASTTLATGTHTAQTGDSYAIVNGDHGLVSIQDDVDNILADTNELQTDWVDGGRLDNLLDGAASAGDPWTTSLPGAYGAGTAGYLIGTYVDAPISTVDTVVDNILADTDELQSDWTDGGRLDLIADAILDTNELQSDDVPTTLATLATSAELADGTVQVGTIQDGAIGAAAVADIFSTTNIAEAYTTDTQDGTPAQLLYEILQSLTEFSISSTTLTVKQRDGSTATTYTLDSDTTPTLRNRTT